MNDVIIVVDKNAMAYKKCSFQKIGNEQQNLQNKLKFEFEDEVVEGQAWLEYEIDGVKKYTLMEKYENGYQIDIKNCLLTSNQVSVDLKITQDSHPEGVPVFVTNIITFDVEKTICAEEEEPEQYPNWFETANKIINEANNLNLDINKNDKVSTIIINKKDGTQKSVYIYDGTDGQDATINGQNALTIANDDNITIDQKGNILKLGLNSQLIPKNKVEETENIFEDSLDMPLFEFSGDGKSEQVTTEGYNELEPKMETSTRLGVTCTNNGDGSFTLNGTAQYDTDFRINQSTVLGLDNLLNLNGEYTLKCDSKLIEGMIINITQNETWKNPLTINHLTNKSSHSFENFENCFVDVYIYKGTVFNNFTIKPFLYKGTEDKPFEPYTKGQASPSPDYEQPINSIDGSLDFVCRVKNLFDVDKYIIDDSDYYSLENKNLICNSVDGRSTGFIYTFFEKGIYTVSTTNVCNISIHEENNSYLFLQKQNVNKFTFTLEENKNLHFKFFKNEVPYNIGKIQIEKDSIATEYNPYVEPNEVTLDLGEEKLRSIENIKDEFLVDLNTGDYYKIEKIGEFNFNDLSNSNITDFMVVSSTIGEDLMAIVFNIPTSLKINHKPVSNKFCTKILGDQSDTDNINNVRFYEGIAHHNSNSRQFVLSIKKERVSELTLNGIKNWLLENNVIINCQLQTPTTKKLGTLSSENLSKLKTFDGYNNIKVNTNLGLMNIRLTYGLDIKKYVDNKIKNAIQI